MRVNRRMVRSDKSVESKSATEDPIDALRDLTRKACAKGPDGTPRKRRPDGQGLSVCWTGSVEGSHLIYRTKI